MSTSTTEETFVRLMRRANTLRRIESDPIRGQWWVGYMRGLRRAHHAERGAEFGTAAEHAAWCAFADADDPPRASLGRGYLAGLASEEAQP